MNCFFMGNLISGGELVLNDIVKNKYREITDFLKGNIDTKNMNIDLILYDEKSFWRFANVNVLNTNCTLKNGLR